MDLLSREDLSGSINNNEAECLAFSNRNQGLIQANGFTYMSFQSIPVNRFFERFLWH